MKYERKPERLKVRLTTNENFHEIKRMMRSKNCTPSARKPVAPTSMSAGGLTGRPLS